jgi:hypothetical protein
MDIAVPIDVARMDLDDSAAYPPRFRIPGHVFADFELVRDFASGAGRHCGFLRLQFAELDQAPVRSSSEIGRGDLTGFTFCS